MQADPSFFASAGCLTKTAPNAAAVLLWHAMTGAVLAFDAFLLMNIPSQQGSDG